MKARIFGTLFVLAILAAVYILTYEDKPAVQGNTQQVDPNAGALQGLKIN